MRKLLIASICSFLTVAFTVWLMLHFAAMHRSGESLELSSEAKRRTATTAARADAIASTPAAALSTEQGASEGDGSDRRASGPTLYGKVTDEQEKPLSDARIVVLLAGGEMKDAWERSVIFRERLLGVDHRDRSGAVAEARTDSSGIYAIPISSIPRGKFRVIANCDGYKPGEKSWAWTAESSELSFELGIGKSITGVVSSADGNPISKAVVEAYKGGQDLKKTKPPAKDLVARAETASDGKFSLGVSGGKYRVAAYAEGFSEKTMPGIPAGTKDLEIVLSPGHDLGGRVVDEQGLPIAEARLSIFPESAKESKTFKQEAKARAHKGDPLLADGASPPESELAVMVLHLTESPVARAETDADGRFELQGLSHGRYVLLAEKDGFEPGSKQTELADKSQPAPLEMKLLRGHVLGGVVTDPSGKPVSGAFLTVSDAKARLNEKSADGSRKKSLESGEKKPADPKEGPAPDAAARENGKAKHAPLPKLLPSYRIEAAVESDREGRFQFNTLRKGTYVLKVEAAGFLTLQKDGLQVNEPVEIAVALDSGIRLEGKVLSSADGKPVPKARIRMDLSDLDRREVASDEEGRYKIPGLPPGRIKEADLRAPGFSVSVIKDLEVAAAPPVQVVDFKLDASATVSGAVTDAKGNPVSKARVVVAPVEDGQPKKASAIERAREREQAQSVQTRTDETSAFSLLGVSAGPAFRVAVTHTDFKPFRSDPFPIRSGENIENLRYTLFSGARLELLVRDAQGAVAGARAKLTPRKLEGTAPAGENGSSSQGRVVSILGLGKGETQRRTAARDSGKDGRAVFTSLAGGEYLLSVASKGHQPFSLPVLEVEEQTVTAVADLLPENTITGVVQDRSGASIFGVRVSAVRQERGEPIDDRPQAKSDVQGEFRVGSLGDGTYVLRARHEGFADAVISVEAGGRVTIVLERLGGLAGSVLTAETGEPVTSFQVRWREADSGSASRGRGGAGNGSTWQGADKKSFEDPGGAFRLENLRPGSYLLRVTDEHNAGAQVRATVREGVVTEGVRVLIQQGVSVIGFVEVNPAATPVSGARIYLLPHGGGKSEEESGAAKDVREVQRQKRRKLDAEKRQGVVHNARNDAARPASLAAKVVEGNLSPLAVTDADGNFRLKDIPVGSYHLLVDHPDLVPAVREIVMGDDGVAVEVNVALDAGESLTGIIALQDGSKAAGSLVIVREATGLMKRTQTDPTGRYLLQGLIQGAYALTVETADFTSPPQSVKVAAGANHFDYRVGDARQRGGQVNGVEKVSR